MIKYVVSIPYNRKVSESVETGLSHLESDLDYWIKILSYPCHFFANLATGHLKMTRVVSY